MNDKYDELRAAIAAEITSLLCGDHNNESVRRLVMEWLPNSNIEAAILNLDKRKNENP